MVLTREAVEQNTYYEHGFLYYTCLKQYPYTPPDIIPEKMKDLGYKFTGQILYVYDGYERITQKWFEVKRSRTKRYILA